MALKNQQKEGILAIIVRKLPKNGTMTSQKRSILDGISDLIPVIFSVQTGFQVSNFTFLILISHQKEVF